MTRDPRAINHLGRKCVLDISWEGLIGWLVVDSLFNCLRSSEKTDTYTWETAPKGPQGELAISSSKFLLKLDFWTPVYFQTYWTWISGVALKLCYFPKCLQRLSGTLDFKNHMMISCSFVPTCSLCPGIKFLSLPSLAPTLHIKAFGKCSPLNLLLLDH
jgi:hypothetical protein